MSKSAFTKSHLDSLKDKNKSHLSPLAVIAHVDLDAFYAQCEQVRLGLSKKDPVVCRQWNGLIAISYAARKYGITRHETAMTAKEKCKDIIFAHVATFKKGETEWKYHDNPRKETHKVSLDPFRRESRKIFGVFKEFCPVLEKASIDETYFDLGTIIYKQVLKLYPDLELLKPGDALPAPPKLVDLVGYEWTGCVFGSSGNKPLGEKVGHDLYDFQVASVGTKQEGTPKSEESEFDPSLEINDWDDVCILLGSAYIRDIRKSVLSRLSYTCSAGIARNRTLAKLASGRFKPASQTIVRTSVIPEFLDMFELSDIGGLGGKLGEAIKEKLDIPDKGSIKYLRNMPRDQMLPKLSPKLAKRVKNLISGEEAAPINTRTDIKSMMATKNFTNDPVNTAKDAREWLKVFAAELQIRIMELSVSKEIITMYPKTMNLSFKSEHAASQNRQIPFPTQVPPERLRDTLYALGCTLLNQVESEKGSSAYPCSLLAFGSSNFQNNASMLQSNRTLTGFFQPISKSKTTVPESKLEIPKPIVDTKESKGGEKAEPSSEPTEEDEDGASDNELFVTELPEGLSFTSGLECDKCGEKIPLTNVAEHKDFHFAQELYNSDKKAAKSAGTGSKVVTAQTTPLVRRTVALSKQPPKTVKRMSGMPEIGQGRKKKKKKIDDNQTFLKF